MPSRRDNTIANIPHALDWPGPSAMGALNLTTRLRPVNLQYAKVFTWYAITFYLCEIRRLVEMLVATCHSLHFSHQCNEMQQQSQDTTTAHVRYCVAK